MLCFVFFLRNYEHVNKAGYSINKNGMTNCNKENSFSQPEKMGFDKIRMLFMVYHVNNNFETSLRRKKTSLNGTITEKCLYT